MLILVYVVGPPGAGKTTLMRALTRGYEREPGELEGCPLIHLYHPVSAAVSPPIDRADWGPLAAADQEWRVIELGRDRDTFAGTDALSMSIQPKATAAMNKLAADPNGWLVLAEGDRLANDKFLQGCEEAGWDIRVVYLATPLAVCEQRRTERGSQQNEAWVHGRITKSRTLAQRWGGTPLAGEATPEQIAARLAELITYWHEPEQNRG